MQDSRDTLQERGLAIKTAKLAPGLTLAVLFLAGLNMLAVGLLGEMQVRHYHEPTRRAPYSVDRVLRAQSEEHTVSE